MPKFKKSEVVVVAAFLAFLFAWHYRADLIDITQVAAATNAALAEECR